MRKKVKKKNLAPEEIARKALALLKEKENKERARKVQKYFKEEIATYGLSAQEMEDLGKELYQTIKEDWGVDEAIELCEILLPHPFQEAKGLAIFILAKYWRDFPKNLFFTIKRWLSHNYCNNWALVDYLCPEVVGSLLEQYPELVEEIKEWAFSQNRWVKRASVVSFIKLARQAKYFDTLYHISSTLFSSDDDLIQKANGWLLREAGKRDVQRLEKFLLNHGPAIPRTTLRYAIERFDEKRRKELLVRTRSS